MIDNKELAKYIWKEIQDLKWRSRGELFTKLTPDALAFWIQQHRLSHCAGHYEWSEKFKRNVWIKSTT